MKNFAKMVAFLGIFALLILGFYKVFRFKYTDGIYNMDAFRNLEKDSLDVLVLGSSHAYVDINPAVFWSEYGIAAYDLCGSNQPMWNTYYYLKEALKTQTPKVVVLEAYCVSLDLEYIDEGRIIKNYYGLSPSMDKLRAGMESVPKDQWKEYLPEWVRYHNRYQELEPSDFLPYLGQSNVYQNWKGFGNNCAIMETYTQEDFYTEEAFPLHEKAERYYRKIIELTKAERIPLYIIVSPYCGINREEFGKYNRAEEIAGEYGIPFVNYNLLCDEIGIDYGEDGADSGHLNHIGSEKLTKYLGNYLKEQYALADHRGDETYISWDINVLCTEQQVYNQRMTEIYSMENYLRKLDHAGYIVILSIEGQLNEENKVELVQALGDFGINEATALQGGTWVKHQGEFLFYSKGESEYFWHQSVSTGDLAVKGITTTDAELYFGPEKCNKVGNGINVLVYDTITETLVDAVGFDAEQDWWGVR